MICPICKRITPPMQRCCSCQALLPVRTINPTTFTLLQVWERCNSKLSISSKSPKTIEGYQNAAKKLKPYFSTPIAILTKDDYQDLIDLYAMTSYSTQHELQQVIHIICKEAISLGLIYQDHTKGLILTGRASKHPPVFSLKQIQIIKNVADSPSYTREREVARLVLVLICTGYRPSELFNIKKEAVDPVAGYMISGSKTMAGQNRCVPVIPFIASYLTEFYLSTSPGDYMFRSPSGSKMNIRNFRVREFYPLMANLGFNAPYQYPMHHYEAEYKLYSCRHTFASLAYSCGIRPEMLIKIIGHTSFDFTMAHYVHPDLPLIKRELEKLDHSLSEGLDLSSVAL